MLTEGFFFHLTFLSQQSSAFLPCLRKVPYCTERFIGQTQAGFQPKAESADCTERLIGQPQAGFQPKAESADCTERFIGRPQDDFHRR